MGNEIADLKKAIAILKKEGTRKGLQTLGYPEPIITLFEETFSPKWAYPFAKWFLEYYSFYNLNLTSKDQRPPWHSMDGNPIAQILTLKALIKAMKMNNDKRKDFLKSKEGSFITSWISARNIPEERLIEGFKPSEDEIRLFDAHFQNPSEVAKQIEDLIIDSIKMGPIKAMAETDFAADIMANKGPSVAVAKNQTLKEAISAWEEKKDIDFPIFAKSIEGWVWKSVGTTKSEWVKSKFRNCGSPTWGALAGDSTSQTKNEMLVLFDPKNKPRAMITFNPSYKSIYEPEESERVPYLGYPEGPGSQPVSSDIYPHIKELIKIVNPKIISIPSKEVIKSDGERLSNLELKSYLNILD